MKKQPSRLETLSTVILLWICLPLNLVFLVFPEMVDSLPVHSYVHEKRPEEVRDSVSSYPGF